MKCLCVAMLMLALTACSWLSKSGSTPHDHPTKGFPTDVRESVYLPLDRTLKPPAGYGLYTVLLTRTADRNSVRLLSELFATTGNAADAALARENLNLIIIPVKSATETSKTLTTARNHPDAAATTVMQQLYDFDQAALLMASVCSGNRDAAILKVCGSTSPDGPLLVTTQLPLSGIVTPGQKMLIVNLSTTPPEAIGEVLAAYRRQILRSDYADRAELDGWRLWALNRILDTAKMLPGISKAYAGQ